MQRIKRYTVVATVYGDNLEYAVQHKKLESQVNEHLANGWQPYGPLVSERRAGSVIFAQPMVQYED